MGASMKDVAKRAGVSASTVSHVINGTRFVREETKKKVREAMEQLDYQPNLAARSLRSQRSHIIGFLVPDISNFFFTGIARGLENNLRENGYNLVVGNSDEKLENEKSQIKIFNAQYIDGLIMAPAAGEHSYLNEIIEDHNYPVVFIDRIPKGFEGDCVLVDNEEGSHKAVKYLIDKGHREIGIITGLPGLTTTDERLKGYKRALTENNLEIRQSLIKTGNSRADSGYELTKELIENTDITALYVTNNLMSIGAMEYLKTAEIQVPDELAIIGFDDYKWASITSPPLSVVKQPIDKIGEKVAEVLLDKINNKEEAVRKHRLQTELILRKSC